MTNKLNNNNAKNGKSVKPQQNVYKSVKVTTEKKNVEYKSSKINTLKNNQSETNGDKLHNNNYSKYDQTEYKLPEINELKINQFETDHNSSQNNQFEISINEGININLNKNNNDNDKKYNEIEITDKKKRLLAPLSEDNYPARKKRKKNNNNLQMEINNDNVNTNKSKQKKNNQKNKPEVDKYKPKNTKNLQCYQCKRRFFYEASYLKHERECDGSGKRKKLKVNKNQCEYCFKKFKTNRLKHAHKRMHKSKNCFCKVEGCAFAAKDNAQVRLHYNNVHVNKSYKCKCGKICNAISTFNYHQRRCKKSKK